MTRRSGQASLEYLLTYGWALLAVLVAIGALAYFTGGFGSWAPDTCTVTPPFACVEAKAQEDGTILLGIQNGGEDLGLVNLTLACDSASPQNASYATTSILRASERLNGSIVRLACPPVTGRFDGRITVVYRTSGEDVLHDAIGKASLTAED